MSEESLKFVPAETPGPKGSKAPVETRMSLMLRPAKLVVDGHEMLCLLREVNGLQLRIGLFNPVPSGPVQFELPDGMRLPARLDLIDDHSALLTLDESFDPAMLRRDWSGYPGRQVRLNLHIEALLYARETCAPMTIRNISQKGAQIESGIWLRLEEPIRIETGVLPPLFAWVRWRRHPSYGITFDQVFRLDEIALLCAPDQLRAALSVAREDDSAPLMPPADCLPGMNGPSGRWPGSYGLRRDGSS